MIKAIIFDFDGLILDTETAWFEAYKWTLQKDYYFELTLQEFAASIGSEDTQFFAYLKRELGSTLDVKLLQSQVEMIHEEMIQDKEAREGVASYLKEAKARGLKIALATSSTRYWVERHLRNLHFLPYFDHLITQDDVKAVKPAPDLFLKTIKTLDVEPKEAIVFEDSLNGLIAAENSGLQTIVVPNPVTEHLPFENYHLKLKSMNDMCLEDVLKTVQ